MPPEDTYIKEFDKWNEKKKHTQGINHGEDFFFHEREVWWCTIGVNVGVEADGKNEDFERPVLIVKKFNGEMFWGVSMTSRKKSGKFYFKVTHEKGDSWVNLSQLRVLSDKRLLRKIGMIPEEAFADLKKKFAEIQS